MALFSQFTKFHTLPLHFKIEKNGDIGYYACVSMLFVLVSDVCVFPYIAIISPVMLF